MPDSRSLRLVETALRCYPRRWRSRHGHEAAEIASLLIRDGVQPRSIACSYLIGAARMRLVIEPRRRLAAAVCALLLAAGSLGLPLALLSLPAPASAASVTHATPEPCAARPRPADPRPAGLRYRHSRPAGPRPAAGSGAARRCDRHDQR